VLFVLDPIVAKQKAAKFAIEARREGDENGKFRCGFGHFDLPPRGILVTNSPGISAR
jgi:hypothetical protein